MAAPQVISVNVGAITELRVRDAPRRTGIIKRPVKGPVEIGMTGLSDDHIADPVYHGGPDQAVYIYSREDYDWWAAELGIHLANGTFGENITARGLDVSGALIGETWHLGTAVVQITAPRIPCGTFAARMAEPGWVKRFAAARRPGAYLRVLTPGAVRAGDPIRMLSRPARHVTIAESMLAHYGDTELMRRLLTVDGRAAKWERIAERVLGELGPTKPERSGRV